MMNDKDYLVKYNNLTGGIMPLQNWYLQKPDRRMLKAGINVLASILTTGGIAF